MAALGEIQGKLSAACAAFLHRSDAGSTFGRAGVIRGNLTPECAAAVRAVVEALGKKAGPEDDRTERKRFHDALQLACASQPRVCHHPGRAASTLKRSMDLYGMVRIPWRYIDGV
jgi:hypothetical protein